MPWKLLIFAAIIVLAGTLLAACEFSVEPKQDIAVQEADCADIAEIKAASAVTGEIVNPVIVICFSDENAEDTGNRFDYSVRKMFTGEKNSLEDYYKTISFGRIEISTLFPQNGNGIFVYKSAYNRGHYKNVKNGSKNRTKEESELLNAAIRAASDYFDFQGKNLDVNNDGYVDTVSFLVSGSDTNGSEWGGLLWPHSWDLTEICNNAAQLNGKTVNKYTFNFIDTVDVGYLCHETGHVFGMPDLYHYNYDTNYIQVADWDIMHLNEKTPQFPTTYMRDKYLGVVGDGQIIDIKKSGSYSLSPTSSATAEDVLAYRVKVSDKESVYFEYRNNSVSTYDSKLPGSGLIVYRTNNTAKGNVDGKNHSTKNPDEVYVFRPSVATGSNLRSNEISNLSHAYLSPSNGYFYHLGMQTETALYSNNCIYTSDGRNTGIMVRVTAQTDKEIRFDINLNGSVNDEVAEMVILGNTEIDYGEEPDITVKIKLGGHDDFAIAPPQSYKIDYDPEKVDEYQKAKVVYTGEDGEKIEKEFDIYIRDPVIAMELLTEPEVTTYKVGERIDLTGLAVTVTYGKKGEKTLEYFENESSKWLCEEVDLNVSGECLVNITYLPYGKSVYVKITVVSDIKSIFVSEKDTRTIIGKNETFESFKVMGICEDGTVRQLEKEEFAIGAIDYGKLFIAQTINISLSKDIKIWCSKTVYVVDETKLISISNSGKIKTVYSYGEELSLSGGVLDFNFENGKIEVPAENYYAEFNKSYNSAYNGRQVLTASIFGVECSYTVNVLTADSKILVSGSGNIQVNTVLRYVLFFGETTYSQALQYFASYLNIRFVRVDGKDRYELKESLHGSELITDCMEIELTNDAGKTIMTFKLYVRGDANSDGKVDFSDADGWATALFCSQGDAYIYLDINGDGKYTLTDYVLLCDAYGGRNA